MRDVTDAARMTLGETIRPAAKVDPIRAAVRRNCRASGVSCTDGEVVVAGFARGSGPWTSASSTRVLPVSGSTPSSASS